MKIYDRKSHHIRKNISVNTVAPSDREQVSEVSTLRTRSAYRKQSARLPVRHYRRERGMGQTPDLATYECDARYTTDVHSPCQGLVVYQSETVRFCRRARKRNRYDARRMDKAVGSIRVLATDAGAGSLLLAARAFIRGANWNNTSNAGVFTLNLNNAPSNTNTNIGFRCSRYTHPRMYSSSDELRAHRGGGVRSARTKNPEDFRPCQEMYGNDPSRAKALEHIEPIPTLDTSRFDGDLQYGQWAHT